MSFQELQYASAKFDKNLLYDILKTQFGLKEVTVENISYNSDVKKGDSYLSVVVRCTIEANGIDEHNVSKKIILPLIVKGLSKNLARRKTFRSVDFFKNECTFYTKIWPAMKDLQKEKNVEIFNEIPLCYYAFADGTNDFIALEDVTFKGFRGIARSTGLDFTHTVMLIKLFARFHALSLALKEYSPQKFEQLTNSLEETYWTEKFRPWYENFQKGKLLPATRDAIKTQLPEIYLKKFDEITSGDFFGDISGLCTKHGKCAVFTHGDAWVPNFLAKCNETGPTEIIMIDFQLTRYASLAQDILFFLFACTMQDLRQQYWNTIIEQYYKTLTESLGTLGLFNVITLEDIKKELKEHALFGLGMSLEAVVMSILGDEEVPDVELLEGEDAHPLEEVWNVRPFRTKEQRQRIANVFKDIADRWYL